MAYLHLFYHSWNKIVAFQCILSAIRLWYLYSVLDHHENILRLWTFKGVV
jgi:hypothetical protein